MIKPVSRLMFAAALLAACTHPASPPPTSPPAAPGSDRDAHGCIASAGYSWCAYETACVRPWELAQQSGFANDKAGFDAYCARVNRP